jgi:hypothetical protein
MAQSGCTIITPFLTPFLQDVAPRLRRRERANIGDGFILRAVCRLLAERGGAPEVRQVFSSRLPFNDETIEKINDTRVVILAGANQLKDKYTLVPGMTPALFQRLRVPVIPMGIGLHGRPARNVRMSRLTARLLRMMHERIAYSSWRCPRTVQYLLDNLPELAPQALMTGCPVQYQPPLLAGAAFTRPEKTLAVTVTDHGGAFWDRGTAILQFVAREFPAARRILSLHQDYRDFTPRFRLRHLWAPPPKPQALHRLAASLGYEIFSAQKPEDFFELYQSIDGHFGSRLHAHLYLLGHAKASYLTQVDNRCVGFAEAGDFPLFSQGRFDGWRDYDFERYRLRVRSLWPMMEQFLASLQTYANPLPLAPPPTIPFP